MELFEICSLVGVLNVGIITFLYPIVYTFNKNLIECIINYNYLVHEKDEKKIKQVLSNYTEYTSTLLSGLIFPNSLANLFLIVLIAAKQLPISCKMNPSFMSVIEYCSFFSFFLPILILIIIKYGYNLLKLIVWKFIIYILCNEKFWSQDTEETVIGASIMILGLLVNYFVVIKPFWYLLKSQQYAKLLILTNFPIFLFVICFLILSTIFSPLTHLRNIAKRN